jgi:phosphatidylethanolamine-binding protein (PEBP) family uncharacterized protein
MRAFPATPGIVLACAVLLAGCGSSTATTVAHVTKVTFKSRVLDGLSIPARYTCDGAGASMPLEWGPVPATTRSLVLFVVGLTPEPSTNTYKFSVEWALAGISPSLHRLVTGEIPPGAYPGVNSAGNTRYKICPARGVSAKYQFELYGLPGNEKVAPRFGALTVIRELETDGAPVNAHGIFYATYTRI